MTDNDVNIPNESQLGMPERLAEDVKALLEPQFSVPPEVDRAVLDRAGRHFAGRQSVKTRRRFRRVVPWKVAAAAAVVILAFSLNLTDTPQPDVHYAAVFKSGATDFDGNGRVDILDAFKLARQIELASGTEANLDINGDGLINRDDVDMVALAAVSLAPPKQGPGKGVL